MQKADQPITPLALRAMRLRKLSAAARKGAKAHRRFSAVRLQIAELILGEIINGGDMLAEVTLEGRFYDEKAVCVLVTMRANRFHQLIEYDADIEDDEDTNDAEETDADVGELPLGWGVTGPVTGSDELEPSLGSTHMLNQGRWAEGHTDGDNERDRCDDEENGDHERDRCDNEPSLGSST